MKPLKYAPVFPLQIDEVPGAEKVPFNVFDLKKKDP